MTGVFSGDLLPSEDASLLARRRYASIPWMRQLQEDDCKGRGQLDEAMKRLQAKFEELNHGTISTANPDLLPQSPTSSPGLSVSPGLAEPISSYPEPPPIPSTDFPRELSLRVRGLQSFLRAFEYCHLGHEFHGVSKERSFASVMKQAREMIKDALPIKCLEAVALATLLTKDWKEVERLPLRFKTRSGGHSYWHIVLAITDGVRFGSVGLSRRCTLDFRPLNFPSLSSLVESFRMSYDEVGHDMHTITVGLPMPRKEYSAERIHWHFLQLPVLQQSTRSVLTANKTAEAVSKEWVVIQEILDRYCKLSTKLLDLVRKHTLSSTSSSSFTSALFIPPAAMKALGVIHDRIAYDSSEVALIYRPSWSAAPASSITIAKPDAPAPKCVMSESSSSSDGSGSTSSESEGEEPAGSPGAVPKREPEEKSALPTSPLPSSTAKSPATLRRMAERAERRRAKQLVESLRDKHRLPLHSPSSASSNPPPAHSPVRAAKKRASSVVKPAASPTRSPEKSGTAKKPSSSAASTSSNTPQHTLFSPPIPVVPLVRPSPPIRTLVLPAAPPATTINHTPRLGPDAPLHSGRRSTASPVPSRTADPSSSSSASARARIDAATRASTSHGAPSGQVSARGKTPMTARGDSTPRTDESKRNLAERPPAVPVPHQQPNSARRPATSSSLLAAVPPPAISSARSSVSSTSSSPLLPSSSLPLARSLAARSSLPSGVGRNAASFSAALGVKLQLPEWEREMWEEMDREGQQQGQQAREAKEGQSESDE